MTTTTQLTLTDFLLARIAEEAATSLSGQHGKPDRIAREADAKRRIVEMHATVHTCVEPGEGFPGVFSGDEAADWFNPCPTLDAIAAIYADHPDYRAEWAV